VHELGIAQQVLRIIETHASEHGDGRVRSLRLRVGELSGADPESVRFALAVCSNGTRAEGMAVEIVRVPARLKCRKCAKESAFDVGHMRCPACGSSEIALEGGDDLQIESFEMD